MRGEAGGSRAALRADPDRGLPVGEDPRAKRADASAKREPVGDRRICVSIYYYIFIYYRARTRVYARPRESRGKSLIIKGLQELLDVKTTCLKSGTCLTSDTPHVCQI